MNVDEWLSAFGEPVDASDLASPDAAALVSFVGRHASHLATVVEVRRADERELVILEFRTGRPQDSVYPIKRQERIGVRFSPSGSMPLVYMLRDDFPDTEHQQLPIEGAPRAICIDDRIWGEARLTWTPAELVQRILTWFSRAARGDLHDARQPIDPVLFGSPLSFFISRAVLNEGGDNDLIGIIEPEHRQILRVKPTGPVGAKLEQLEPICIVAYRIPAERMRRMAFAPNNLGSLADMLGSRGIDLFADLSARFSAWLDEGRPAAWRLGSRLAIIIEMPIVSPNEQQQAGTDLRAFLIDMAAGDIAAALGIALKTEQRDEGSAVGYVKLVIPPVVDQEAVRAIEAQVAEVHYEFDRTLATQLAGRGEEDERNVVLVGAGAIGSLVSDCLLREGRFRWTVIDDDRLLPHNIGRHVGHKAQVGENKAAIVSRSLESIIDTREPVARAIAANLLTDDAEHDEIDGALEQADLIIDASASVLAARFLSDHPSTGRRASVFFNPPGNAAVLLAEPVDRALTLRDLEAQYLGLVASQEVLTGHLATPEQSFAYTGACRAITNLIPQSRIMTLSGLVAGGLSRTVDQEGGTIKVWSLRESGAVDVHEFAPEPVTSFQAGDWKITLDSGLVQRILTMRAERLPNETGGVLLGVVDIPEKSIHLVGAAPAPPDSKESRTEFVRGTEGVQEHLDRVFEQTRGQVRYLGEWHSHPPRSAAVPSATDLVQIDWLATLFDMDTLPALMVIAGDTGVSVVLANREASPVDATETAAPTKRAAGGEP